MPATDSAMRPRGRCALKRMARRSMSGNIRRQATSTLWDYARRVAGSCRRRQRVGRARFWPLLLFGACLPLAGCETVALAVLGAGASSAIRYNLDGIAGRTFTAPLEAVKSASLAALERMGLSLDTTSSFDTGETIYARAPNRDIEIELEPITKQLTRLRVTAKGSGILYDNSTAVELVAQTEKQLDNVMAKLVPAVPAQAQMPSSAAAGSSKIGF